MVNFESDPPFPVDEVAFAFSVPSFEQELITKTRIKKANNLLTSEFMIIFFRSANFYNNWPL